MDNNNSPYHFTSQTHASFQPQPPFPQRPDSRFMAFIREGIIYADTGTGPQAVGVVSQVYQELEQTAAGYRDRLIEMGEIEVPLTQEQINAKLLDELKLEREARQKAMQLVDSLMGTTEAGPGVENES